jgi:hypothetical protein
VGHPSGSGPAREQRRGPLEGGEGQQYHRHIGPGSKSNALRGHDCAWDHLFSSFVQGSSATVWIRDLTEEGIEPNPGHLTCAYCSTEIVDGVIRGGLPYCSDQHWMEHLQQQPEPTLSCTTRSSRKRGSPSSSRETSPVRSSAPEEEEQQQEQEEEEEDDDDDESDDEAPIPKQDKSARGGAFERQVLKAVKQHPKVQDVVQIGQSGDKLGDLYVRLKEGDDKERMVQCRIKTEMVPSTGLKVCDMKKFAGVVFVLLHTKRRTFYVLMPEEWEETKGGAEEPEARHHVRRRHRGGGVGRCH